MSPAREKKIADFIDDGNVIPNSVLISFQHAKLSRDKTTLTVDNRQDAGWIIDGQHRLAAIEVTGLSAWMVVVRGVDLRVFTTLNDGSSRTMGDALEVGSQGLVLKSPKNIGRLAYASKGHLKD
ncbi:MAG: hypothetical protein IID51_10965, partial [Proteobacteria bacterium]|nr:hypothetical protein [Pseudomonadota bacterium]